MIVLRKNDNIVIPNYDDLENKPKINGVTLEGSLTTEDLGINVDDVDLTGYATEEWVENQGYLTSVPSTDWLIDSPMKEGYIKNRTHYIWNERVNKTVDMTSTRAGETLVGGLSDGMIMQITNTRNTYNDAHLCEVHQGNRVVLPVDGPNIEGVFALVDNAIALVQNNAGYGIPNELKFVVYNEIKKLDDFFIGPNIARRSELLENYYTEEQCDNKYQEKGEYLTSIPSEYITETELDATLTNKGYATTANVNNALSTKQDKTVPPNNEVWYTTTDGNITTPRYTNMGANLVSNTYENGKGVMVFDGDVTKAKSSSFQGDATLKTITLPNSLTLIDSAAFYNCPNLTTVSLSSNLTTVNNMGFSSCPLLTTVFCRSKTPFSVVNNSFGATIERICVPADSIENYKSNNSWINTFASKVTGCIFDSTDDLHEYATTSYVDTQIGDINTILENIIG